MTNPGRYDLSIARPARRALSETLPEPVAFAAWELIDGPLRDNPHRLGGELHGQFAGLRSARRSTYRVLYRIDEKTNTIHVLDVAGRGDVYRLR